MNAGQDFMNDALICGRRFRISNGVNDFNRKDWPIEMDLSLPAASVTRTLNGIIDSRGIPRK